MSSDKILEKAVHSLVDSEEISIFQAQNFLKDLKQETQHVQLMERKFGVSEVNSYLLKHFIRSGYQKEIRSCRKGLTHPQVKKEAYQNEERNQEESENGSLSYVTLDLADIVREQARQLKAIVDFCKWNISDLLLFKDEHKIRPKHEEFLSEHIGISAIRLVVYRENGTLHSYNSKINYMSEIYETHPKYDQLVQFCKNSNQNQFFYATENPQFCELIGYNRGVGVVRTSDIEKYLMVIEFDRITEQVFAQLKQREVFSDIFREISWKIIEMSLSQSHQLIKESVFNYYAKNWIELLQLSIKLGYQLLLRRIVDEEPAIMDKNVSRLSQIAKQLENTEDNALQSCSEKALRKGQLNVEVDKFEDYMSLELQNLRLYRKMIDTKEAIFIDFNSTGKICFISTNFRHQVITKLKKTWKVKSVHITDLFFRDKQLQHLIKKGSQGLLTNGKFYELDQMKAKVFFNEQNYIERIQVLIENQEGDQYNSESKSSSTNVLSEGLQKLSNKSNQKIMKRLEKMDPDIKNQGWISLFLKGEDQKEPPLPNKSAIKNKRTRSENNMNYVLSSETSLESFQNSSAQVQAIDVDKLDLNLLTLGEEHLEPFVIKVMCKLAYFKDLTNEKNLFGNFVRDLHENYQIHGNPFHNFIHGVNVMHTSYLISSIPKNKQVFTPLKVFSIVFSSLCHDVGHTGFTNSFQIASRSQKALTYNDVSPLQNYHASRTFQLLRRPANNFMCLAKKEQWNEFRKDVISNILFTDIKEHFPLLKKFEEKRSENNLLTPEDSSVLSGIIVHASDFGGSVKEFEISRSWSERVNKQFTNQYEQEGKLGITQTPFMANLTDPHVLSKNESGFLKFIVQPLYKQLHAFYVDDYKVKALLDNLTENITTWDTMQKQIEQQIKKSKQAEQQTNQQMNQQKNKQIKQQTNKQMNQQTNQQRQSSKRQC